MYESLRREAETLFNALVDEPMERQRALLEARCGSRIELREEVERLLRATDDRMGDFLSRPLAPLGVAPRRVGRYLIERQIGAGGMGLVFAARQEHPDRTVALKVLRPGLFSPASLRRFHHEVEALAALQHQGIAQIFEAGTAEMSLAGEIYEQPYFAMELIHGEALTEYARKRGLSAAARLSLLAEICDAVQHAHQKGIIHRDLKPANILVDQAGRPKVLDFGVARVIAVDAQARTAETDAGQLIGTLAYMSPEQLAGDAARLDTRSDVYTLGVVGYQLLADRLPFQLGGLPLPSAIRVVTEQDAPKLGSLRAELRGDVEAILAKAIEKDPDRRYASAAELSADIRRYLNHEPVTARGAGTWYQLRKFARRNRGLVTGAGVAALALILGGIGTATFAFSAAREAKAARLQAGRADAVVLFLRDMFDSLNPALSKGRDVTVREIVDAAAAKLSADGGPEEPDVEATVRNTIGTAYLNLGDAAAARPHFEKAVELIRATHGPVHPDLPGNLTALGETAAILGEFQLGAKLNRESLEITQRLYSPRSPEVAMALSDLGVSLSRLDDLQEAESLHRRSLEIRRADPTTPPALLAQGLSNLGSVLTDLGPPEEAEAVLQEALRLRRAVLDPDHPDLASSLNNLGVVLKDRNKVEEAELALREALDIRRRINAPRDPMIAPTLNNLAIVLQRQGKNAESIPLLEEALAVVRAAQGPDHPNVARSMLNIASALSEAGDSTGSEKLTRESIDILRRALGDGSPQLAAALNNLGAGQVARGDLAGAVGNLREALHIFESTLGPDNASTAHVRDTLGVALNGLEEFDESLPLLEKALETRQRTFGEHDDKVARTLMNLAVAQLGIGQPGEAVDGAERAVAIFRTVGDARVEMAAALVVAAEACVETGAACAWWSMLDEAAQLQRTKLSERHWRCAEVKRVRGRWLTQTHAFPAAESVLLEAFETLDRPAARNNAGASLSRRKTIAALAELYDAWACPEAAALWAARE